jgi:hypothetical protein
MWTSVGWLLMIILSMHSLYKVDEYLHSLFLLRSRLASGLGAAFDCCGASLRSRLGPRDALPLAAGSSWWCEEAIVRVARGRGGIFGGVARRRLDDVGGRVGRRRWLRSL